MKKIISALVIIILTLQSCLHVYQPLITENDLVSANDITGKWTNGRTTLEIEEYGKSWLKKEINANSTPAADSVTPERIRDSIVENHLTYILSFQDRNFMYYYVLQATRIDSDLYTHVRPFLILPVKDGKVQKEVSDFPGDRYNSLAEEDLSGSFAFARVIKKGDRGLVLKFFDGEKISKLIRTGKMKVPYEFDPVFNNFLVTAETADLRAMVSKYGNNEDLYSKQYSFELTRKAE